MKKIYQLLIIGFCLLGLVPRVVSANAPPPPSYFYVRIENAPENAVYGDVLIEINEQAQHYTAFNESNGEAYGITADSAIVAYKEGGYQSLSFHYDDVQAAISIENGTMNFVIGGGSNISIDKITDTVKVALLDKDGNIIQISEALSIVPPDTKSYARNLYYNADKTMPEISYSGFYNNSSSYWFLYAIFIIMYAARILLSSVCEMLIAIPFKLKPIWKIFLVNLFTQIALITFMELSNISYWPALIIGECGVYIFEGLIYLWMFKAESKIKVLIYTVVANTVTLVIGLIVNYYFR